jgi:hypothetical protein
MDIPDLSKPWTRINYKLCGPSSANEKQILQQPKDRSVNYLRLSTIFLCVYQNRKIHFFPDIFFFPPTDPISKKKNFWETIWPKLRTCSINKYSSALFLCSCLTLTGIYRSSIVDLNYAIISVALKLIYNNYTCICAERNVSLWKVLGRNVYRCETSRGETSIGALFYFLKKLVMFYTMFFF